MNRIEAIFVAKREAGARALMPYVTLGDPDLAASAALLPRLEAAGASICELGIPFSDPIADGPVIQDSMHHALTHGLTLEQVWARVREVRPQIDLGLVAMVSYSIAHRVGLDTFLGDAAAAGIDGLILPDLSLEEAEPARATAARHGLTLSLLVSPTTPTERARAIAAACTGFVYLLSRAGITGERSRLPPDLPDRVAAIREVTDLPIAVGFGISNADQVRQVVTVADAAIVGSAVVRQLTAHRDNPSAAVDAAAGLVADLAAGLPTPQLASDTP